MPDWLDYPRSVSGRGAIAGGVMVIALLLVVPLGMQSSGFPLAYGGGGSGAAGVGLVVLLFAATAVAGMIAFDEVSPWRAAGGSVAGHILGVVIALGPAGWVASLTDSIVFPVVAISVLGVSIAAVLAARRVTLRLALTGAVLLGASLIVPLGGTWLALFSVPVLYLASSTVLPTTVVANGD
jgi:hypothetical protein